MAERGTGLCWCHVAVLLLYAYWTLACAAGVLAFLPVGPLRVYQSLLDVFSARGQLVTAKGGTPRGHHWASFLVRSIENYTVPHSWFFHFYLLGTIVNSLLLTLSLTLLAPVSSPSLLLLILFQIHLIRRLLESTRHLRHPACSSSPPTPTPNHSPPMAKSTPPTLDPPPPNHSSPLPTTSTSPPLDLSPPNQSLPNSASPSLDPSLSQRLQPPLSPLLGIPNKCSSTSSPGPQNPAPVSRMHLVGYLVGMSYYVATPLTLFLHFRFSTHPCSTSNISSSTSSGTGSDIMLPFQWSPNDIMLPFQWSPWISQHKSSAILDGIFCCRANVQPSPVHSEGCSIGMLEGMCFLVEDPGGSPFSAAKTCSWNEQVSAATDAQMGLLSSACALAISALGVLLFAWGSLHQFRCHKILWELKCSGTGYSVPYGDWFHYISCPHYTAEILLYMGFLLVTFGGSKWDNLDPLPVLLLCWVVLNLAFAAMKTHAAYKEKFPNYPTRAAIFPFFL